MNRRNLFDSKKVVRRKRKKNEEKQNARSAKNERWFSRAMRFVIDYGYIRSTAMAPNCLRRSDIQEFFLRRYSLFFQLPFHIHFVFFFSCVFNILSPFSLSLIVCALRRPFSHLLYPLNFILRLCTVMKFVHIEWIVSCVCVSSTNEFCFCRTQNRI